MKRHDFDVVVVGAGTAGLAALRELDRAGLRVLCLEARDRIGGRVYTLHEPLSPMPIELGAEFIHGRSPEIWAFIRSQGLLTYDCDHTAIHVKNGRIEHGASGWELIDEVMQDMQKEAAKKKDKSFSDFLEHSLHSPDAKQLAASYVEGFNAARKELASIRALAEDVQAADRIHGDRSFRFIDGYDALVRQIAAGINGLPTKLRVNAVVRRVEWTEGRATVEVHSTLTTQTTRIAARRVVVTVPIGVLQRRTEEFAGSIAFHPDPQEALHAASTLKFGQVMRVVFRFREPFWEKNDELAAAGFLLSDERFFPTWWTLLPVRAPILVGWSAGPHADEQVDAPRSEIISHALDDLARITSMRRGNLQGLLEAVYFHHWHADPFAGGAYSYVPVGALSAREALAKPVAGTLYFAGEATETNGHSATVHGAIASGRRAARQILDIDD
jgi:monoamine oxidase